jgi:endonuclease-8
MPEGPEVRRYALQLNEALKDSEILHFSSRLKGAKRWLLDHPTQLIGRKIESVCSHGKHLYGTIEGELGFHSHLMMWGRWFIHQPNEIIEIDKRERARIGTTKSIAILFSAPVFEIFEGNPYDSIENLRTLGPDILPYDGHFKGEEFKNRLLQNQNLNREIGAVLLDQRVCAGIGNYFRADLLFLCRINPWKKVAQLSESEIECLVKTIPVMAKSSLEQGGVSIPPEMRERLLNDETLSYNGRIVEWGARHATFRRTNLPCLRCGNLIRQKHQVVYRSQDGDIENEPESEKSRIIYFCPVCQGVDMANFSNQKTKKA